MQEIHHFFHSLFSLTLDFRVRLFKDVYKRQDIPDGAELTVGCNDSPAIVVNKVFC